MDVKKRSLAPVARAALQQNPVAALRNVEVYEEGGRLVLTGRLRSYYLKQLAQEAVLRVVSAEVQIENCIVVERKAPGSSDDFRRSPLSRTGGDLVSSESY